MAFIDNPVIAGLGEQLGMGAMFDSMRAGNPSPDPTAPTSVDPPAQQTEKPGKSAPNVPEYKNRPYIPRVLGGNVGGVRPGVQGGLPTEPGTMDPATLQNPNVRALLGQYGVTPSTTPPDPNLFLHNPQAYANHPMLAGMLERGLESLAYSHPGANFLQSFTGSLRGNQEADAARGAQYNAQAMAPVQQALAIQNLQKGSDEHADKQSEMEFRLAQAKHLAAGDLTKSQRLFLQTKQRPDGSYVTPTDEDANGNPTGWKVNPDLGTDYAAQNKQAYYQHAINAAAALHGGDPSQITDEERAAIDQHWAEAQSLGKGAAAIQIGAGHDAASIKKAGISASTKPGNSKMNPADAAEYQTNVKQDAALTSRLNALSDTGKVYQDENGNMLVGTSKKRTAYIQQVQAQQAALRARQQEILRKYRSGNSSPDNTPAPNPSAAPKWNPITGRYE